jgi:hypothetical protein
MDLKLFKTDEVRLKLIDCPFLKNKMSLSTLRNHKLIYEEQRCWYNAMINSYAYNQVYGLNLKWVVGALKLHSPKGCVGSNGFMNYDGDTFTLRPPEDLKENWDDTHAWLEDDEGYVYDYITEHDYSLMSMIDPQCKRFRMKSGFVIGETYASLKKNGYELIPYSMESRKVVLQGIIDYQNKEGRHNLAWLMSTAKLE